ncbi:MAG: helix-turn-helix transcriptional regulator [Firmicutes bacterium]|nr:helix-turn-helix transcriptional regulator [Bacillota bacterium]
MNAKEFGEKISALRKKQGLTQMQLAEKLNVSNKTISRWETGEGYPDISVLSALANHLHVTVDQLLADEAQFEPEPQTQSNSEKKRQFYNKEDRKPLRHSERPVCWPASDWKDFVRNTILSEKTLHLAYFLILTLVFYSSNERFLYKSISNPTSYGFFSTRYQAFFQIGFLFIATLLLILWNLKTYCRGSRRCIPFLRNMGLIGGFVLSILFSICLVKGTPGEADNTFYSVEKARLLDFVMMRTDRKIILICGTAVILIYLIFMVIEHRRKRKNTDSKWKNFWKSLTVFNKISVATILISMVAVISYLLLCATVSLSNFYGDGSFYFFAAFMGIFSFITAAAGIFGPKIGCAAALIGLIAGVVDKYDRQYKASMILAVVNLVISYLLPVLVMITQTYGIFQNF